LFLGYLTIVEIPLAEISVISKLGEGAFSEVFRAEWFGLDVVLKKFKINTDLEEVNKTT